MTIERTRELIEELESMGATVTIAPQQQADLDALRAAVGFDLPAEYVELCTKLGALAIATPRTTFIYGPRESLAKTREYAAEFAKFRAPQQPPYYPSRFFVVTDQGDYSNVATGVVWDADLDAFLMTDGGRWVERKDARKSSVWQVVIGTIEDVLEQLDMDREEEEDDDEEEDED